MNGKGFNKKNKGRYKEMLNKEVGYVKLGNSNINIKGSNGIGILTNGARRGTTSLLVNIYKQLYNADRINNITVLDPKQQPEWNKATGGKEIVNKNEILKEIKRIRGKIETRKELILDAGYDNIEDYIQKDKTGGLGYEIIIFDEMLPYYKNLEKEEKKELLDFLNDILVKHVCLGIKIVYAIYRIDEDLKNYYELTNDKIELLGIENGLCKMLVNGKEESDKFELYEMKLTTDKEKKSGKTMKNRYGKDVNWMKYIVVCNGKEKEFEKEGACVDYKKKMERKGIKVKVFYEDSVTSREEIFKNKR